MEQSIIIAGFGRSGTTWLSDILSKALGGLILFEPDHPSVCPISRHLIYKEWWDESDLNRIHEYLVSLVNKEVQIPWLLRNHLPSEQEVSDSFHQMIWTEAKILGFKTIRWNHNLKQIHNELCHNVLYIIRYPLSVVSSLLKREKFFEEYGWNMHWELFKQRNPLKKIDLDNFDDKPVVDRYMAMWTVSNIKAIADLKQLNLPLIQYEKLYAEPFKKVKIILADLGFPDANIHPAHIFYPSMSTLKTMHTLSSTQHAIASGDTSFFWREDFSQREASRMIDVIKLLGESYPDELTILDKMGYLAAK